MSQSYTNRLFIFDYDDTLADNIHDYSGPKLKFAQFVIDTLERRAPEPTKTLNMLAEEGKQLVATMGFSKERFPTAMKNTYNTILKGARMEDPLGLEMAYRIGTEAFSEERYRENGLVDGAIEALEYIANQGDQLILLTKGDRYVQNLKLDASGVRNYIDNCNIVDKKTPATFLQFIEGRDTSTVWSVGNSMRSDIQPSLEAGINAVYIPCETWAYERVQPIEHERLTTVQDMREFLNYYKSL